MNVDDVTAVCGVLLAELPAEVSAAIDYGVKVRVVADASDPELSGLGIAPDFKGVFLGRQQVDADEDTGAAGQPAEGVIYLNAANLADGSDVEETLYHEVGHALGMSEQDVRDLGLDEDPDFAAPAAPKEE